MNWEQKLDALNKLETCALRMRAPGDWYVEQRVEVKNRNLMIGAYGKGATPEAAVEEHWKLLTEGLADHQFLVARSGQASRAAVRWNGYMWGAVAEKPEVVKS